jgi:hypothetical protein
MFSAKFTRTYCPLQQRMQFYLHNVGAIPRHYNKHTQNSCHKQFSITTQRVFINKNTDRHLLVDSFVTNLKSHLCRALTKQESTEISITSHTHRARLYFTLMYFFLAEIHRLLVTNTRMAVFRSANHCQGQRHTPLSVMVPPTPHRQGHSRSRQSERVPVAQHCPNITSLYS